MYLGRNLDVDAVIFGSLRNRVRARLRSSTIYLLLLQVALLTLRYNGRLSAFGCAFSLAADGAMLGHGRWHWTRCAQ